MVRQIAATIPVRYIRKWPNFGRIPRVREATILATTKLRRTFWQFTILFFFAAITRSS
jgi:hypothetical protein